MINLRLIVLGTSLAVVLPAAAADKNAITPRQVAHCMLKQMKANQHESYREAFKVCKQQLDPAGGDGGAATAMNSGGVTEPPKQQVSAP